jgi:adenylate cyclase class IV
MELEVVLAAGQSEQQGFATAVELMARLGIADADLVDVAYIDLLDEWPSPTGC